MALLLALLACADPAPGGLSWFDQPLPEPEALPTLDGTPPLLVSSATGAPIADAAAWRDVRVQELQRLLTFYAYGDVLAPTDATAAVTWTLPDLTVSGAVGVGLRVAPTYGARAMDVLLVLPDGPGPFPVVLGLNKCGNASVLDDDRVPVTAGAVPSDCPDGVGARASYWDLQGAVAAGWAVATFHQSDVVADDATALDAASPGPGSDEAPFGAVAAWAWGLRVVASAVRDRDDIGPVWLMGHSRRGKAALWAGALSAHVDGVWAHQSGTLGATLSRSTGGESVRAITTLFPHWFTPRAAGFADREAAMPFDQHGLLALIAPRPLLLSDGADDTWADPPGAAAAADLARPAWPLLGAPSDALQHTLRPGGHEVTAEDWAGFLRVAGDGGGR